MANSDSQARTSARLLRLSPLDNIVVTLEPIERGDALDLDGLERWAMQDIPLYHKVAARTVNAGEKIIKYGVAIGSATRPILPGEHVHTHNLHSDYLPTPERSQKGDQ